MTSQSPVAPGMRRLESGVRVSMIVMEVRFAVALSRFRAFLHAAFARSKRASMQAIRPCQAAAGNRGFPHLDAADDLAYVAGAF